MSLLQKQLQQHSFFSEVDQNVTHSYTRSRCTVVGDPPLYQLIPLSEGIDLQWRVD